MSPKEFLKQAWQIDARIDARIEERERLESMITSPRMQRLTGMPRGGRGRDWTDSVAAIDGIRAAINRDILLLCRVKREVNAAIDAVEDLHLRTVLELRYRNYMPWEQIARVTGYTLRNVFYIHGEALKRVRVPHDFLH